MDELRRGLSQTWTIVEPDWWSRAAGGLEVHLRVAKDLGWEVSVLSKGASLVKPRHIGNFERAVRDAKWTFEICERVAAAENSGVVLNEGDKQDLLQSKREAQELRERAEGRSAADDPMRKGNAFPMGVGFTRMTKRTEQRIDASVRRAGENVAMYRKADSLERHADSLLAGVGTAADKARKANNRLAFQRTMLSMLLDKPRGKQVGEFVIERVNLSRDGYPTSYTCSGPGLIKGVNDKVELARELFAGDRQALERMVDEIRAASGAPADTDESTPEVMQDQPRPRDRGQG